MKSIHRNKLLMEYPREELEGEFLKNCEILDKKTANVHKLEQKIQYLSLRLSRLKQNMQFAITNQGVFVQSQTPFAFRKSQMNVKELQEKKLELESEISHKKTQLETLNRQIIYFKSLQNFSSTRKQNKISRAPQSKVINLTSQDIQYAIEELIEKNSLKQMRNRLIAASAILQEDYKSAEEPLKSLMDSIGEDMSLFDVLEKWKQIHDKESKINLLTTRLNALEERYEELKDIHEKQEQQYEEEHKIIERYHQEAAELERQKEIKAAEIQKIKELKSYSEKLQKEVNELTKTKEKLQDDQKERNEQIRKQFEEGFSNMKGEVKSLEDELSDTNKQNEALEEELNNIKPQYEETKSDREKVENTLNELQEDYKKILETFSAMADSLDYDPFEDQRFLVFLSQMSEKSWTPETVKKYSNSIEKLTAMLDEQKEKLAKYESTEDILNKRITTKRQKISTLEEQLKNLSQNLDQNDNDKRKNSDYTRSAIHIKSFESPNKVGQGLVEIVIYFGNFKPSPSIAKKDSKFFISLSLFDQDPKETQYIDPTLGFFDSKLSFICKNDFVLKVYIEKGSIFAQFCRVADGRTSKIGQVELILSPFIEGTRKFTSTAKIMSNSEREIGEVTFEAGISAALAR